MEGRLLGGTGADAVTRIPDICFKHGGQVDLLDQVSVPTPAGTPRVCCVSCAMTLSGRVRRRMSVADQSRVFRARVVAFVPRRTLGLSRRDFQKKPRPPIRASAG